jgi:hypothetical protein
VHQRHEEHETGEQEQQPAGESEQVAGTQAGGDEKQRGKNKQDPAPQLVAKSKHGRHRISRV